MNFYEHVENNDEIILIDYVDGDTFLSVKQDNHQDLVLVKEAGGNGPLWWVAVMIDGKEDRRFNANYLASIYWNRE